MIKYLVQLLLSLCTIQGLLLLQLLLWYLALFQQVVSFVSLIIEVDLVGQESLEVDNVLIEQHTCDLSCICLSEEGLNHWINCVSNESLFLIQISYLLQHIQIRRWDWQKRSLRNNHLRRLLHERSLLVSTLELRIHTMRTMLSHTSITLVTTSASWSVPASATSLMGSSLIPAMSTVGVLLVVLRGLLELGGH